MAASERIPDLDLYEELEVSRAASRETIEAAYRSLAKRYHPDVSTGPDAHRADRIKRINIARDWLTDPSRRALYDASRAARSAPPTATSTPGSDPRAPRPTPPPAAASPYPQPSVPIVTIPWALLLSIALAVAVLFPTVLDGVASEEVVFGGLLVVAVFRLLQLRRSPAV